MFILFFNYNLSFCIYILDLVLYKTWLWGCTSLYLLCSGIVNYFLSNKYCIHLIGVFMLLFVILK